MPTTIQELLKPPPAKRDTAWLCAALQAAVELEFFTLPPYLTAMWSVIDEADPVASVIRQVAYEEMEHMALACNMLAAVGGAPVINRPPAVPQYPGPMPGGVKPDLTVALAGLSKATLETFKAIEAPEKPLEFPVADEALVETFPRIGAFYDAIAEAFRRINPALSVDRQLTGPLAPMTVATLAEVEAAIARIKSEGEGSDVSPATDTPTHFAHYYLFEGLQKEKKLEYDAATKSYSWGKGNAFPKCYPAAEVPPGGYEYDRVTPDVAAHLRTFDETFTAMVDELHLAWNGGGQAALWRAVEQMFALRTPARALMATPIPDTETTYGPNFRYLSR